MLGTVEIEGRMAYKLKLLPKLVDGEKDVSAEFYYIDTKSLLLVKRDHEHNSQLGKTTISTYYNDYRDVDGIKLAFEIITDIKGYIMKLKCIDIRHNVDLPADAFTPPAEVQALIK